ncbi:hypothetical protein MSATCC14277_4530 [Metamycoplasma salivarium]|nr:sugar-phosphate nucleotidyltransferase [Metamycoplasma salivarium]GIZ05871.1 hypothetical protein MSATCC14277_4530 [Metamycoplasma salivarium]GIZ07067.1 hypothetical protein MSATCC33130_4210 [Metamycoplasma salivarium]
MKTNNFNQIEEILEDKIVFNDRNSLNEYINSTIARNKNSITHAFNYANDDEWYTTREDVQHFIDNAKIPKNKIIWCPFDTKNSNFVFIFEKNGYKVVYSHIWDGQDFYSYEPKKWDIIVSNPPFRNKHKLLERLLTFNKPWALIFGIQCLNSEKFCDMLQKFERPQYVHLKRRMCFTKDSINYDLNNLQRPSFATMWVCNNLFDKDIQVWSGVNYKKDKKEYC